MKRPSKKIKCDFSDLAILVDDNFNFLNVISFTGYILIVSKEESEKAKYVYWNKNYYELSKLIKSGIIFGLKFYWFPVCAPCDKFPYYDIDSNTKYIVGLGKEQKQIMLFQIEKYFDYNGYFRIISCDDASFYNDKKLILTGCPIGLHKQSLGTITQHKFAKSNVGLVSVYTGILNKKYELPFSFHNEFCAKMMFEQEIRKYYKYKFPKKIIFTRH